jgi:hypothetical protein
MTTPMDEDRVGAVMRDMLRAGAAPAPAVDPSELRRGAQRRSMRRVDTKVVVALAAVAAVLVALIVVGPLRSDNRPTRSPTVGQPTSTTTSTSTTSTTPPTTVPAGAASALDTYVADEAATDAAALKASGLASRFATSPFLADHSAPVADDGRGVAVAAFTYDPGGHPVQVLEYNDGQWTPVAALAAPSGQFASGEPSSFVFLTSGPVSVADVTGDGEPDFLVLASAADNVPGFVVSDASGTWGYIPFSGPGVAPLTDVLGRNAQFQGNTLESVYDSCLPDCAAAQDVTITWTYQPSTDEFTAPDPPGYITPTTTGSTTTVAGSP